MSLALLHDEIFCEDGVGRLGIYRLSITHNRLRKKESLDEMVRFVKDGGIWDINALRDYAQRNNARQSPLIQISRFDDGVLFIHDGHHRVASVFKADRVFLSPAEFEITDWTYQQYLEISHENNWYTPFDPRTYCRAPDFAAFKKQARQRFLNGEDPKIVTQWILDNPHLYCEPREVYGVRELLEK